MGTKIEWCEETWNPVTGCSPVSTGCKNCYAKRMATRLRGRHGYPKDDPFKVTVHHDRFSKPLRWKKPRRVFVCSMGDLFHEDVPTHLIHDVWATMVAAKRHTFLVLTKRPKPARAILSHPYFPAGFQEDYGPCEWPLPNVWIGVTAENQARADERIPVLLEVPAAVRFVSVEPMLEQVNLDHYLRCEGCGYTRRDKVIHGDHRLCTAPSSTLDWIICGAETGSGKRWMSPEWAQDLAEQCDQAEVPFFFKKDSRGLGPEPGHWREFPQL